MGNPKVYAILHIGRCGSTVLSTLLNQQEGVRNVGEVLEQQYQKHHAQDPSLTPLAFVASTIRRASEKLQAFSLELKCVSGTHLDQIDPAVDGALARLAEIGIDRFVLLHRSNLLDRIISQRVAAVRGSYVRLDGDGVPPPALKLSTRQIFLGKRAFTLLDALDELQADVQRIRDGLERSGHPFMELDYDQDINPDPIVALRKVADFIGFPVTNRDVSLKKVVTVPKRDFVTNLDEVRTVLVGTRYEWMLG